MSKTVVFLSDSVPTAMVAMWFTIRTITGTVLPVEYEPAWQLGAAVTGILCWVATVTPWRRDTTRLLAGIAAVTWLTLFSAMLIGAIVAQTGLGQRISWVGIWQYLTTAVLIAYLFGRRPHPWTMPR